MKKIQAAITSDFREEEDNNREEVACDGLGHMW